MDTEQNHAVMLWSKLKNKYLKKQTLENKVANKGPYIKYVGGGGREFLWGHEIFYAYIDGP